MKEGLVYGIFGGLIGSLYLGWVCSSKSSHSSSTSTASLAVVDMQLLVSRKSRQLAMGQQAAENPALLSHLSIQEAAISLKDDLDDFAVTHNLVLLAKGSVVGGDVPDKTQEVLDMMEKGGV
jgi:hypothetical protein